MPKRKRTEEEKESAGARKRAARQAEHVTQAQARPQVQQPCGTCIKNNDPAQDTHSRLSSRLCPYYKPNKCKWVKSAFDGKPELFTIKTRCKLVYYLPSLQQEISATVEKIHDVTYEVALLANQHFICCMEEDGILMANCFSQIFFLYLHATSGRQGSSWLPN